MTADRLIARLEMEGGTAEFDLSRGVSIGIPIGPSGRHPRFFIDRPAEFAPLEAGAFTGSVRTGASCNAGWVRFAPHCHGTHIEGPGHLTEAAEPVTEIAPTGLLPARLVSVEPVAVEDSAETAPPGAAGGLIESAALPGPPLPPALVIRTLPNGPDKRERDYTADPGYPVLSLQAVSRLVAHGVEHLLLDTPSLDPAGDGGRLANHRAFWSFGPDNRPDSSRSACTITEMIYVPDSLADGACLVALNPAPLGGDAAASAPVLFPKNSIKDPA